MASVISDPNGRKRIQFVAGDGSRRTIRLGKATSRQAEAVKVKVEQLVLAATGVTGVVDDETANWLTGLDDSIYNKLAGVGLVSPRESARLGVFIDGYISERSDVKVSTAIVYGQVRKYLVDYFGTDKLLREITPGDVDQWRLYLVNKLGLSDNTVRRRTGIAKQYFRAAVRRKLISENPFDGQKVSVQANRQRDYFVSRAEAQKVLDACPNAQWRLIFGLARFGGLRCPSEIVRLKWQDIDFEHQRFTVHASKTEHHADGGIRIVPIFPELKPLFQDAFDEAKEGAVYCVEKYSGKWTNVGVHLRRIIKQAGIKPWPKLLQNLRSTRETELCESWPEHVVCNWIGNTRAVARKHYLQVTDEHFERAIKSEDAGKTKAAQNAAQQMSELSRTVSHTVCESAKFNTEQDLATQCEGRMGGTGLEPVTSCVSSMVGHFLTSYL
jgi:integrase